MSEPVEKGKSANPSSSSVCSLQTAHACLRAVVSRLKSCHIDAISKYPLSMVCFASTLLVPAPEEAMSVPPLKPTAGPTVGKPEKKGTEGRAAAVVSSPSPAPRAATVLVAVVAAAVTTIRISSDRAWR